MSIKNDILERANSYINDAFKINNPYKLVRFEKLQKYLINKLTQDIKNHYIHIDIWFKSYLEKFKYEYNSETLRKFQDLIMNNFYRYIHADLYINNPFEITDKELLIENDEWKLKRTALKEEITKYNNCKTIIANL